MRARRPPLPPQPSSHPLRRPPPTPSTPRLPPAPSTPRLSPAPSTPRLSRSPAPTSRLSARAVFSTSEVHRGRLALTPPPHPHLATATPSPARLACTTRPAFAPQAKSKMLTSCVSDRPSGHEDTHYDHLSGLRLASPSPHPPPTPSPSFLSHSARTGRIACTPTTAPRTWVRPLPHASHVS